MKTGAGAALGALLVMLWALSIESAPSLTLSEAVAAGSLLNQEADFPLRALNIELGIRDHEPTRWDGSLRLSHGQIAELRGHHFTDKDELGPDHSWKANQIRQDTCFGRCWQRMFRNRAMSARANPASLIARILSDLVLNGALMLLIVRRALSLMSTMEASLDIPLHS